MSLMQRIPLHAKEVKIFKPDCLKGEADIPAFTLKAPTRQHREDMIYALHEAGFRRHDVDAHREATIEELCRLWECDKEDESVSRLKRYWEAVDEHSDARDEHNAEVAAAVDAGEEPPAPLPPFSYDDQPAIDELLERLDRGSKRLRRMQTDNARYGNAFPRYAIAHCVVGWTGMETQPRFEDELLTLDSVFELEEEFETRFPEHGTLAMEELAAAAIARLFLSKEAEKNLESGPASQRTPSATKRISSASPNGNSQASEPSPETPAA